LLLLVVLLLLLPLQCAVAAVIARSFFSLLMS